MLIALALLVLEPDDVAISAVNQAFERNLLDFGGARFDNVRAWSRQTPRPGEAILICGRINARNGLGGFAGWTDFRFFGHWDTAARTWVREPTLTLRAEQRGDLADTLAEQAALDVDCSHNREHGEAFELPLPPGS